MLILTVTIRKDGLLGGGFEHNDSVVAVGKDPISMLCGTSNVEQKLEAFRPLTLIPIDTIPTL